MNLLNGLINIIFVILGLKNVLLLKKFLIKIIILVILCLLNNLIVVVILEMLKEVFAFLLEHLIKKFFLKL